MLLLILILILIRNAFRLHRARSDARWAEKSPRLAGLLQGKRVDGHEFEANLAQVQLVAVLEG